MSNVPIDRSEGVSKTETLLFELCDRTFLKLWTYANPYKADGHEMCDLITVFDNHVFIFFDRHSKALDSFEGDNITVPWKRWKKATITKQLKTVSGAERYLRNPDNKLFLDAKGTIPFPITINRENLVIHKIIVAHGAAEACRDFSPANVRGSLSISYTDDVKGVLDRPFHVALDNQDIVHVFDSDNLDIILTEFDTITDLLLFFKAKEDAIKKTQHFWYAGEEDLISVYYRSFDEEAKEHFILPKDAGHDALMIEEGMWDTFVNSNAHSRRKDADKISYHIDRLIQSTSQNALAGLTGGDPDIFNRPSAIKEMAKEPRYHRRALSEAMFEALDNFPNEPNEFYRSVGLYPSNEDCKFYVFLIVHFPGKGFEEGRDVKIEMLKLACGAAKLNFSHVKKVIGLAIEAPHLNEKTAEDYILMEEGELHPEQIKYIQEVNTEFNFFQSKNLKPTYKTTKQFPD